MVCYYVVHVHCSILLSIHSENHQKTNNLIEIKLRDDHNKKSAATKDELVVDRSLQQVKDDDF